MNTIAQLIHLVCGVTELCKAVTIPGPLYKCTSINNFFFFTTLLFINAILFYTSLHHCLLWLTSHDLLNRELHTGRDIYEREFHMLQFMGI